MITKQLCLWHKTHWQWNRAAVDAWFNRNPKWRSSCQ